MAGIAQEGTGSAKSFTIAGKVPNPDRFKLRDGMRVADGIIAAGGFSDCANQKKITVMRGHKRYPFDLRTGTPLEKAGQRHDSQVAPCLPYVLKMLGLVWLPIWDDFRTLVGVTAIAG